MFALVLSGASYGRTWTSAESGKTIEADFVKKSGDSVTLLKNGREVTLAIGKLSKPDQEWIAKELEQIAEEEAEALALRSKIEYLESENLKKDFKNALQLAKDREGILIVKIGKPR